MAVIPVPYKTKVSLSDGSSVTIKGTPNMSFCMNPELQIDFHTETEENSNIAFHFHVYFGNYVVMNTRECGHWGPEVKSYAMPFAYGEPFELHILALQNEYRVMVNGCQYYTFTRGLNPGSVKMMEVWRDITLTSVIIN